MNHEKNLSGGMIEHEVFGSVDKKKYFKEVTGRDPQSEKEFRKFISNSYINFQEALDLAKRCQSYDNSDPEPRFANDLHAHLAEKIGLEDYSELKLYTAVGSQLDYWHGIDGFFEFKHEGKTIRVTIDVTSNPQKDKTKADVLLYIPAEGLDPKLDKVKYSSKIGEAADDILHCLEIKK